MQQCTLMGCGALTIAQYLIGKRMTSSPAPQKSTERQVHNPPHPSIEVFSCSSNLLKDNKVTGIIQTSDATQTEKFIKCKFSRNATQRRQLNNYKASQRYNMTLSVLELSRLTTITQPNHAVA